MGFGVQGLGFGVRVQGARLKSFQLFRGSTAYTSLGVPFLDPLGRLGVG